LKQKKLFDNNNNKEEEEEEEEEVNTPKNKRFSTENWIN